MKSDRNKAEDLIATWDRLSGIKGRDVRVKAVPLKGGPNPYEAQFSEAGISSDDQNLLTSFMLLTTAGFDQPVGKMMAAEAEKLIPYTLHKLHTARERARDNNNEMSSRMKEEFRGQTILAYSWGFTMSRTGKLVVNDREILPYLMQFAASSPDTPERRRLCSSAQNKLESTLGTILQAHKSAVNKGNKSLELFYNGSLMMTYALANLHYGYQAEFNPEPDTTTKE